MPVTESAAGRLDDTLRDLAALAVGIDTGLFRYVGLDRRHGKHIIDVTATRRHHGHILSRGDARHWIEGLAFGQGNPATVNRLLGLDRERSPKMLGLGEAAKRIPSVDIHGNRRRPAAEGISAVSIEYLIRNGDLYPVYGPDVNQTRRFFATQVYALAAARNALAAAREARDSGGAAAAERAEKAKARAAVTAERWAAVEAGLPPAIALSNVDVGPTHRPPQPRQTAALRLEALRTGTVEGWFELLWPVKGGYLVEVAVADGELMRRVVPEARVLPWVEGFGCWHRKERLVTFR